MIMMIPSVLWMASAHADEGMWTPEQVPAMAEQLEEMGLQLNASVLADPRSAPLSAVISLGGCSASFVSPDGLIATNHHCVEQYLQVNATGEADLARDGMLATDRAGELSAGPTARVTITERIDDVTDTINAAVGRRMKDTDRKAAVEMAQKQLIRDCEAEAADRRCRVASFYEGLSYRLIVSRQLDDLRLVYAPPRSVGSYGGEVDNWMWPRHTGDFALLRVYVAPDGSAAPYHADNVPYQPDHHLPLDLDGVSPGEFVMVAGYPGFTRRLDRVSELRHSAEVRYPERLELFREMKAVLEDHSARSPEAAAKLASPMLGLANLEKNNAELLTMLEETDIIADRAADEAALDAWLASARSRRRTARTVAELEAVIAEQQAFSRRSQKLQSMRWAADLLGVAHRAYRTAIEAEKPDIDREPGYQDRDRPRLVAYFKQLDDTIYLPADRDVFAVVIDFYMKSPEEQRDQRIDEWFSRMGGVEAALDALYTEPALADADARLALLEMDRDTFEASDDPWVQLAVLVESVLAEQRAESRRLTGAMMRLRPQVVAANLERKGADSMYPDANSTLRLTFGHVTGWSPADGVVYLPQTTLQGLANKATGEPPFDAPERLLARVGEQTRWADPDLGDVPVNFLSTLDITGGNSGSATLNDNGELVGLAFDGNIDSIGADWMYGDTARTIHVDVRYLLWTLEGMPDAAWLLDELQGK
ncbi:MAG: S46 family peptidase [Myxococcota bacterium]